MESKTEIIFNGKKYFKWGARNYYRYTKDKKVYYLHRDIWSYFNGIIPIDMEIHHKDGNSENNYLSNMEAIDYKEELAPRWALAES